MTFQRSVGLVGLGALLMAVAAPSDAQQPPKPAPRSALSFIVRKDAEKHFRWRLQDTEGTLLAVADKEYPTKQEVRDAVEEFRKLAPSGKVRYEYRQDAKMLYRWKLKTDKGRVLAASGEGYQEKALAEKRVGEIKAGVKEAVVIDKTTN
jgi:uncharacterized protein YegP (UPF0339 family)